MTISAANIAIIAKKKRKFARLKKQFRTCQYPNSGAYNAVPTKYGNLAVKTTEQGENDG